MRMRPPPPRQAAPPATLQMTLGDYKTVNGIKLPHLITRGVNDMTIEEWTIDSYRINPVIPGGRLHEIDPSPLWLLLLVVLSASPALRRRPASRRSCASPSWTRPAHRFPLPAWS